MYKLDKIHCWLYMFALLASMLISPVVSQEEKSNNGAVDTLQSALKKSLDSESCTISLEQDVTQKQSMSNVTINQKTTGTVTYENPFVFITTKTDVSGLSGKQNNRTKSRKIIGKLGENKKPVGLLQKKNGSGKWKPVKKTKTGSFTAMMQRFQTPSKLSEHLTEVQTAGEETINGTTCLKITAKPNEKTLKRMARKMIKGSTQNKMVQKMDLTVDVKNNDMTVWTRKKSSLIERIKIDTAQDVTLSISISGKKRSFTMSHELQMKTTFKKYGSTTIPQKHKSRYEKLINN